MSTEVETSSWSFSYGERVRPEKLSKLAKAIEIKTGDPGPERCHFAARIHQFVAEDISYDNDVSSGFNRYPVETLDKGGNCVDQSVLLSSIFEAAGFESRIVRVGKPDGSHAFTEVCFRDKSEVIDTLRDYYKSNRNLRSYHFHWMVNGSEYWFIADATMSDYLGDISGLRRQGYIAENTSEGWSFKDRLETIYPEY